MESARINGVNRCLSFLEPVNGVMNPVQETGAAGEVHSAGRKNRNAVPNSDDILSAFLMGRAKGHFIERKQRSEEPVRTPLDAAGFKGVRGELNDRFFEDSEEAIAFLRRRGKEFEPPLGEGIQRSGLREMGRLCPEEGPDLFRGKQEIFGFGVELVENQSG